MPKITWKFRNDANTKFIGKDVPLKYLSNFWRTLEKTVINFETNVMLTWRVNSFETGATRFTTTKTKLYVSVVTLSTQDNAKLLQKITLDF